MNTERIIEILIELDGNLAARHWQRKCNGHNTTILRWFDDLELTRWVVRRRILRHDLESTVEFLRMQQYPEDDRGTAVLDYSNDNKIVVLDDPSGLFSPGALFRRSEVFGESRKDWLKSGELPDDITMRYKDDVWTMTPGIGLQKLDDVHGEQLSLL